MKTTKTITVWGGMHNVERKNFHTGIDGKISEEQLEKIYAHVCPMSDCACISSVGFEREIDGEKSTEDLRLMVR